MMEMFVEVEVMVTKDWDVRTTVKKNLGFWIPSPSAESEGSSRNEESRTSANEELKPAKGSRSRRFFLPIQATGAAAAGI